VELTFDPPDSLLGFVGVAPEVEPVAPTFLGDLQRLVVEAGVGRLGGTLAEAEAAEDALVPVGDARTSPTDERLLVLGPEEESLKVRVQVQATHGGGDRADLRFGDVDEPVADRGGAKGVQCFGEGLPAKRGQSQTVGDPQETVLVLEPVRVHSETPRLELPRDAAQVDLHRNLEVTRRRLCLGQGVRERFR